MPYSQSAQPWFSSSVLQDTSQWGHKQLHATAPAEMGEGNIECLRGTSIHVPCILVQVLNIAQGLGFLLYNLFLSISVNFLL